MNCWRSARSVADLPHPATGGSRHRAPLRRPRHGYASELATGRRHRLSAGTVGGEHRGLHATRYRSKSFTSSCEPNRTRAVSDGARAVHLRLHGHDHRRRRGAERARHRGWHAYGRQPAAPWRLDGHSRRCGTCARRSGRRPGAWRTRSRSSGPCRGRWAARRCAEAPCRRRCRPEGSPVAVVAGRGDQHDALVLAQAPQEDLECERRQPETGSGPGRQADHVRAAIQRGVEPTDDLRLQMRAVQGEDVLHHDLRGWGPALCDASDERAMPRVGWHRLGGRRLREGSSLSPGSTPASQGCAAAAPCNSPVSGTWMSTPLPS